MQFKKRHNFTHPVLKNPPIIEALFEIRWNVWDNRDRSRPNQLIDKKFKFFPGIFFEKIKDIYPEVEVHPNARVPDEMDIFLPRYRFRKQKNTYPLIQIGPGVLTVNLDKNFTQEKFFNTCVEILNILFEVLPEIEINETILHYIDGFEFDYENKNAFRFLDKNLHTHFNFSPELFDVANIDPIPKKFHLESSFMVNEPKGFFMSQIRSGIKRLENKKIILMDTIFRSGGDYKPQKEKLDEWILKADELIHKWFLKMIEKIKEEFE